MSDKSGRPLPNPRSGIARGWHFLRGAIPMMLLVSALALGNAAQFCTLVIWPFSRRTCLWMNRRLADLWWGACVWGTRMQGIRFIASGDVPQRGENALVIANHQTMTDIVVVLDQALRYSRVGNTGWFVKNAIRYVPGVGWGLAFLNTIFVKRDWYRDFAQIQRAFARIREYRLPIWLVSFPEGNRFRQSLLEKSRSRARSNGVRIPKHVLLPRTKGFVATVQGLREHFSSIYDLTIAYPDGLPTLWQFMQGLAPRIHVHVRRFKLAELPTSDEELAVWLKRVFERKDELLESFEKLGRFPDTALDAAGA